MQELQSTLGSCTPPIRTVSEIEPLADSETAQAFFGVGERTLRKLVAEGVVPVVKIPGSRLLRFRLSTLREISALWEGIRVGRSPFDDGPGKVAA